MNSISDRKEERFWNQLLGIISQKNVVPVIGEGLLNLSEGKIYEGLAKRYADYCGIELDDNAAQCLSTVARSHPEFRDNPHDIYHEIGEEYSDWNPDIPQSLLDLAAVKHFNLFVSTTFDDLLERALNEVRFDGKKLTKVISYSPKRIPTDEEISSALSSNYPVIFQLFGNYNNPLQFALTEGDVVEYMHALQSKEYCPRRILNELYDRPLLLIGNQFPDWLSRMFLRMVRKTSLDHRDIPKQYFIDTTANDDAELKFFLQRFTTNTELIQNMEPSEFAQKIKERWEEKYGNEEITVTSPVPKTAQPMKKNAIFISYCASKSDGTISEDYKAALALKEKLEDVGVDVWFDKDQLLGGDDYERKIERYINTCSIFMPIISETTNSRNNGFFRKEWGMALKRLPNFTGSDRQFIFPVSMGELDYYNAMIPDEFKRFQFSVIEENEPSEKLINRIKTIYDEIT